MATVLPAWKLELIEKKKRKEEEGKKRAEQEYARATAIPEWKRSLIHKRKVSSDEGLAKKDLSPTNSFAVQASRKTFTNFSNDGTSDRSGQNSGSLRRSKRDGTSQEVSEAPRIKGGVTSKTNGPDSGQSKDLNDGHVFDYSELVENSGTETANDAMTSASKNVAYEHVRRPSVVRLMFQNAAAPKFDGTVAGSGHKHVSPTNSFREAKPASPVEIDTSVRLVSTRDTGEQSRSPNSLGLKPERCQVQDSTAEAHNTIAGGFHGADHISTSPVSDIGVNGDEFLPHTGSSVKSLRDIFGGAGKSVRTYSVGDLPKAVGKDAIPMRPLSPRKRWSEGVEAMRSAQSTEDLSLDEPANYHSPLYQRGRSVSLSDIREEQLEEHFKHKQNVASGLEKRLNKLIRQVSVSEGEMEISDNPSISTDEDSLSDYTPETLPEEQEHILLTEVYDNNRVSLAEPTEFADRPMPNFEMVRKSESSENKADTSIEDNKPKAKPFKGSVHKLSALFGASIWNAGKKDTAKSDLKTELNHSIANEQKQSTKETNRESKVVRKECSEDRSSNAFSLSKNKAIKKSDNEIAKDKVQSETISLPTGVNQTPHTTGRSVPYQEMQQEGAIRNHLLNHKYQDTLERSKSKYTTKAVSKTAAVEESGDSNVHIVHPTLTNEKESTVIGSNKDAPTEEAMAAVPVSAIDMPEPDDVTVSVIDVPSSGVNVSIVDHSLLSNGSVDAGTDTPSQSSYLMCDELSDDSSDEEMEGSYNVTSLDERDSDEDDIPVSCIDDYPNYPVPTIVFETMPENVKSCIRPKTWKKKGKISFREHVVVHDYPSEECRAAAYDELVSQGKTIQTYQPASLSDIEEKLCQLRQQLMSQDKPRQSYTDGSSRDAVGSDKPEITYADDGQAFTDSSDSAGALLF